MSDLPIILIIADDLSSLETLAHILSEEFEIKTASTLTAARDLLQREWVQVVLCDQAMSEMSGLEFLREVRELWPDVVRMILCGYSEADGLRAGMDDAGIYQYITPPWQIENLILTLRNAARLFYLQRENELLSIELQTVGARSESDERQRRALLRKRHQYNDGIVRTSSSLMNRICEKLMQVAPFDISVLISGESGTGKELAARALHYNSSRWDKAFVVENCAALPDELLESELFGYKKGAFTGAVDDRIGLFERADGGTLFLDEIGEVSAAFQVKLLRVLQEGEIRPLGSGRTRKINVRVIAATNKNIQQEVAAGRFREDLYYRLAAVTVELPALRDRKEDIPVLAHVLLNNAVKALHKPADGFSAEALMRMQHYHWPGNVRELQNEIQHMLVMSRDRVLDASLLSARIKSPLVAPYAGEPIMSGSLKDRIETLEAELVKEVLARHRGNKSRAAKELGLSRVGLRNKLERYGLEKLEMANRLNDEVEYEAELP